MFRARIRGRRLVLYIGGKNGVPPCGVICLPFFLRGSGSVDRAGRRGCHNGGSSSQFATRLPRLHEHHDVPWTRSHLPAIDLISSSATTSVNDTAVALASLYIYSFLLTKDFATTGLLNQNILYASSFSYKGL